MGGLTDIGYRQLMDEISRSMVDLTSVQKEYTVAELTAWLNGYAMAINKVKDILKSHMDESR